MPRGCRSGPFPFRLQAVHMLLGGPKIASIGPAKIVVNHRPMCRSSRRSEPPPFSNRRGRVILVSMTHRVGPKGQVVIPKELRVELGIEPGDEVSFWRHGDHVAVRPAGRRRPLRGRFQGSELVHELAAERSADRAHEDGR